MQLKNLKQIRFEQIVFLMAALSSAAIGMFFLRGYLSYQWFNLLLGCIAMPFVIRVQAVKKGSYRFAIAALLFMFFAFYASVDTMVYFSLIAFVFFLIESRFGKVNFLAILTAILVMPISNYLLNTFSFPVRLWLTSACGSFFTLAKMPVEVVGNTFIYNGNDFTVDPACMGLGMLTTSFLIGILLLGFYQKKYKKQVSIWATFLYLTIVLILNIFSNLVRMVLLVLFHILPNTFIHDAVGLLCFSFQVMLPLWAVCYWVIPFFKEGKETQAVTVSKTGTPYLKTAIQLVCCILLWITAFQVSAKKEISVNGKMENSDFSGYTSSVQSHGVTKLENDSALIYLKQIRWFFDSEHNPMVCWGGSGYSISQVQETEIIGIKLYTGILQKGNEILYTAWWYGNGETNTDSQIQWRLDMLKGNPAYSLVNVTVEDKTLLEEEVVRFLTMNDDAER